MMRGSGVIITQNNMPQPLEFFISNIGNTIYRYHHKCCNECDDIEKNWLKVYDRQHVLYLNDIQNDYAREGIFLNYRSIK